MKKLALVGAAATLLWLYGCNNTAKGVSEDAAVDGQKTASAVNDATTAAKITADKAAYETKQEADKAAVAAKKAADNLGTDAKQAAVATEDASKRAAADADKAAKSAGQKATASLEVAPKVQLAIDADKDLNDTHNSISAKPKDGVIHLVGHVHSESMRKKASADATKALKDLNATDTLSNDLTISGK